MGILNVSGLSGYVTAAGIVASKTRLTTRVKAKEVNEVLL